jgi:hypothetical protein
MSGTSGKKLVKEAVIIQQTETLIHDGSGGGGGWVGGCPNGK